uniref:Uncharacterized protein n=1 Tax=Arundo donax TaxID=35708 RepID=A0A0A9BXR2_ARUDO
MCGVVGVVPSLDCMCVELKSIEECGCCCQDGLGLNWFCLIDWRRQRNVCSC